MKNKIKFSDYMWILSSLYLALGIFNILFAWLGLICFIVPLLISSINGSKIYCNKYCGRGQLLDLLGNRLRLSKNKPMPNFLKTNYFRYGFLLFFLVMFINMVFKTYLVFQGESDLKGVLTVLWTFKFPWNFRDLSYVSPFISQFAFGFFSLMVTSTLLGIITMILYKPRSWCVYCPMGTMTQGICVIKENAKRTGI
ncbi:MAG TPA: 4Fe-4S binding protein [Clostridium sp.]